MTKLKLCLHFFVCTGVNFMFVCTRVHYFLFLQAVTPNLVMKHGYFNLISYEVEC
jgi:hypothetical protein